MRAFLKTTNRFLFHILWIVGVSLVFSSLGFNLYQIFTDFDAKSFSFVVPFLFFILIAIIPLRSILYSILNIMDINKANSDDPNLKYDTLIAKSNILSNIFLFLTLQFIAFFVLSKSEIISDLHGDSLIAFNLFPVFVFGYVFSNFLLYYYNSNKKKSTKKY